MIGVAKMRRRTFLKGSLGVSASTILPAWPTRGASTSRNCVLIINENEIPKGYDPLDTENRFQNIEYGLPVLDPGSPLYSTWVDIFERTLLYRPAHAEKLLAQPFTTAPPQPWPVGGGSRFEKSRNWSGAYVIPNSGKMFTQIYSRWRVPSVTLPSGANPSVEQPYACSIWVGLDGQRQYCDSTLPQIGTRQEIDVPEDGSPPTFAYTGWFQWWTSDQKSATPPKKIPVIQLSPGDEVFCCVQAVSVKAVILTLCQFVDGIPIALWSTFLPAPPPYMTDVFGCNGLQPQISGATAEWVVERPARLPADPGESDNKSKLLVLPDYQEVKFKECFAAMSEDMGSKMEYVALQSPRFISMYKYSDDDPYRPIIISRPDSLHQQHSFTMRYSA